MTKRDVLSKILAIALLLLLASLAGCAGAGVSPASPEPPMPTATPHSQTINSIETIIGDSSLPHEGKPHGVPLSYDWAQRPRLGMGTEPGQFRAMTAWGQVYEDAAGSPARNTRVHLRNIKAYVLSKKDGQWHLKQSSAAVEGAAFAEDFVDNLNKPADIRYEKEGGLSVRLEHGYNYHFWPTSGRVAIDPLDIAGVFTTVQARLVVDDPALPDDRSQARYLLSMGGDYWLSLTAQWDQWKTNGDIAIGRFRFVTSDWQAFNMTTLAAEELRKNPPPLE